MSGTDTARDAQLRDATRAAATSPFDTLVRLTSPPLWISLAVFVVLVLGALAWSIFGTLNRTVSGTGLLLTRGGMIEVPFAQNGVFTRFTVHPGDVVHTGQAVATIAGSSGSITLHSTASGTVAQTSANPGDAVSAGQTALELVQTGAPPVVYAYVPLGPGKAVSAGQQVELTPIGGSAAGLQHFTGHVASVTQFPISPAQLVNTTGNSSLAQTLSSSGPLLEVEISLDLDPSTVSGVATSNAHGRGQRLTLGTLTAVSVTVGSDRPISQVF